MAALAGGEVGGQQKLVEDIVHAVGANSAHWCRGRRDARHVGGTGPGGTPARDSGPAAKNARSDNRPGPLTERQNARRKAAQELILSGKASPDQDGVVQLADDKYFQAAVTGTGRVFTILSEFGDQGSGKLGRDPGPLHNEIPEPNRGPDEPIDNSTHWVADFSQDYYEDLFFGSGESFADFYTKQSSGNYTVAGSVSDWVQLPGNASTYGDNAVEDFGGTSHFIEDSGNAWYRGAARRGSLARRHQGRAGDVRRLGSLRLRQRRRLRRAGRLHRPLPGGPRR